jgi:hypothetical protein
MADIFRLIASIITILGFLWLAPQLKPLILGTQDELTRLHVLTNLLIYVQRTDEHLA